MDARAVRTSIDTVDLGGKGEEEKWRPLAPRLRACCGTSMYTVFVGVIQQLSLFSKIFSNDRQFV